MVTLGQELRALGELRGTRVHAEVAIVMDWPSWWALEQDSHPSAEIMLAQRLREHYEPLWQASITTDVVHPESDLSAYRLVIVPNLYLVSDAAISNLHDYVRRGGDLLMSFFSGIADECDRIRPGSYPAPFTGLLGLRISEFLPFGDGAEITAEFSSDGAAFTATLWADAIEATGAEVLARYVTGELAGAPALTRHRYGAGTATYLGTRPDPAAMRRVILAAAGEAGAQPVMAGLPDGVQASRRSGPQGDYLILLNHSSRQASLDLPVPVTSLLDATPGHDAPTPVTQLVLPARGVSVLRVHSPSAAPEDL